MGEICVRIKSRSSFILVQSSTSLLLLFANQLGICVQGLRNMQMHVPSCRATAFIGMREMFGFVADVVCAPLPPSYGNNEKEQSRE